LTATLPSLLATICAAEVSPSLTPLAEGEGVAEQEEASLRRLGGVWHYTEVIGAGRIDRIINDSLARHLPGGDVLVGHGDEPYIVDALLVEARGN
jgi:hypothetical protein